MKRKMSRSLLTPPCEKLKSKMDPLLVLSVFMGDWDDDLGTLWKELSSGLPFKYSSKISPQRTNSRRTTKATTCCSLITFKRKNSRPV